MRPFSHQDSVFYAARCVEIARRSRRSRKVTTKRVACRTFAVNFYRLPPRKCGNLSSLLHMSPEVSRVSLGGATKGDSWSSPRSRVTEVCGVFSFLAKKFVENPGGSVRVCSKNWGMSGSHVPAPRFFEMKHIVRDPTTSRRACRACGSPAPLLGTDIGRLSRRRRVRQRSSSALAVEVRDPGAARTIALRHVS